MFHESEESTSAPTLIVEAPKETLPPKKLKRDKSVFKFLKGFKNIKVCKPDCALNPDNLARWIKENKLETNPYLTKFSNKRLFSQHKCNTTVPKMRLVRLSLRCAGKDGREILKALPSLEKK